MSFHTYIDSLQLILEKIKTEQADKIRQAGRLVADSLFANGIIHAFGTGHSHLIAHEIFYRAGGLAAVNPILDERLIFLKGVLESTRAERETGLAKRILENEQIEAGDVAILISNSGRNAVPVEMALEMRARGVKVIAVTSLEQSRSSTSRHPSGKRLFELADIAIDNGVPHGDAVLCLPGSLLRIGPSSTVAGAAIVNSIVIEAAALLVERNRKAPILPSANIEGTTEETLKAILRPYAKRIRLLDV
ncbi:MAG: sugar isomerase domain-containing protein [Acidobacteriota bacterium]